MTDNFVEADWHRHQPPASAPANWHESFFPGWADLETLSAGPRQIGLSPANKHKELGLL